VPEVANFAALAGNMRMKVHIYYKRPRSMCDLTKNAEDKNGIDSARLSSTHK